MEPEGSLPSLQELSTCTYPEADQSNNNNNNINNSNSTKFGKGVLPTASANSPP
jgi:hypothetical protein